MLVILPIIIKMCGITVGYRRRTRSTRFWSGSPFSPLGRAESEGQVDEVRDCLLRTNEFVGWPKGGDQIVCPLVLLSLWGTEGGEEISEV